MTTNPYTQPIGVKRTELKKFITSSRAIANLIWKQDSTSGPRKIAIAMWLKAVESCEATDILGSRQLYGAAWANLRVAYECLFYTCAILKDPGNSEKLASHHMYQVAKLLKDQINDKASKGDQTDNQKSEIAHYESFIKSFANWPAAEAAKAADMFEQYSTIFRTISQLGAHANISSLDQHLHETRERLMTRGGRKQDRDVQINLAIQCLAFGLERLQVAEK